MDLPQLFIVSEVKLSDAPAADAAISAVGTNYPGLQIGVSEAGGVKCPRCWMHTASNHPEGLCKRCAEVISKLPVDFEK